MHGASGKFTIENPSHPASGKNFGRDDDSRNAMPIGPIPQSYCFIVRVSVCLPEHFNRRVRHPKLEKHPAVEFAVPWNNPSAFAWACLADMTNEHLRDEAFFVELSRYQGPPFKIAAEDSNHIRLSHPIGNDPEVGRPTQQRRALKPNSGDDGSE